MDDFSFRRGHKWGTVLVDLERRTLMDVLSDRSADTFVRWLSEHLGVEVVSRDRSGEYPTRSTSSNASRMDSTTQPRFIRRLLRKATPAHTTSRASRPVPEKV